MAPQPTKGFYVWLREPSNEYRCGYFVRRWRVIRRRLPQNQHEKNFGFYDPDRRWIIIHTPLSDEDFWASLRHEIDHVSLPDVDEDAILRAEYNWLTAARRSGLFTEDD